MNCPQCQTALPDGSAFCNKCGTPIAAGDAAAPKPAPAPPGAAFPVSGIAPPDEPEAELWKGHFSGKALAHLWFLSILWIALIAFAYFKWLHGKHAFWNYACGIVGLLPLVYTLWIWFYNRIAIRYRLTTHRFFRTTGIIARKINEIELMRVDDVSVSQNILQRIFNVGDVLLIATDKSDPELNIMGVDDPIAVKEQIRTHVMKRSRRAVNLRNV